MALHAHTIDIMIPGAIGTIHAVTGDYTTAEAQRSIDQDFIKRPYLSGDTYRSIHPRLETTPTTTKTTVGPTTFYAPLIEFGLARHFTYGPRPFMSIAFATVVPHHVAALRQLAQVAAGPRKTISENPHSGPVNEWIRKFRAGLYDIEKRLGDLVPLGGLPFLRAPREATLGAARVLGDIQAVLGRTVSSRIQARLIGKVTGRLIGIGANTIVAHRTVNTDFGVGQRIYNREAGKYLSRYVSQSRLFRGGR
ncbi:MAG: hypothetical protein R3330_05795 [Saprospiraceae bacterium]|nr:hypothetical protein [Saprospiraceae bacterium]